MHGGLPCASPFRPLKVSADGQPFTNVTGVRIQPDASFEQCPHPDGVCVTELMISPDADLTGMDQAELAWLRDAWDGGATMASSCSGAMLVALSALPERTFKRRCLQATGINPIESIHKLRRFGKNS